MEKVKILVCLLLCLCLCSPAYAESVYMGEVIESVADSPEGNRPGEQATLYVPGDLDYDGYFIEFTPVMDPLTENSADPSLSYVTGLPDPYFIDWARSMLVRCGFRDYVFFRSSIDSYTIAFGDFSDDFSGDNCDVYVLSVGNVDNDYSFISNIGTSFSLSNPGGMVYSNVGFYPSLLEYDFTLIFIICFVLAVLFGFGIATVAFSPFRRS